MAKVVFIGAGSLGFTRGLVRDLLTFPLLRDATLALVDIDPKRLDFATRAAQRSRNLRRQLRETSGRNSYLREWGRRSVGHRQSQL